MTRLLRNLIVAAALVLVGAAGGCAFMHEASPAAGGECKSTNDCFLGELCTDGGACVAQPWPDAGAHDVSVPGDVATGDAIRQDAHVPACTTPGDGYCETTADCPAQAYPQVCCRFAGDTNACSACKGRCTEANLCSPRYGLTGCPE